MTNAAVPNASGMSEMEAVKAIGAPKFTPGPWCIGASNDYDRRRSGLVLVVSSPDWCVADVWKDVDELRERADANAALIAAAPALYDTLTHLIAAARKVSPSDPAAAEIIEMCARAEHEQAKARGETA
jgi:hypothetical protein